VNYPSYDVLTDSVLFKLFENSPFYILQGRGRGQRENVKKYEPFAVMGME
jgi:hypothetical protein